MDLHVHAEACEVEEPKQWSPVTQEGPGPADMACPSIPTLGSAGSYLEP